MFSEVRIMKRYRNTAGLARINDLIN